MALHMLLPPSGRVKATATVGAHKSTGHRLASNPLRQAPDSASLPRELYRSLERFMGLKEGLLVWKNGLDKERE